MFAAVAVTAAAVIATAGLLLVDLYLHHRAERSAGLNRWGYRGPVVGRKAAGEQRIAVLGGSTVFGYGVFQDQTLPAKVEQDLRLQVKSPISVVNLGFNNEGAFALQPTLVDFAYLEIDVAVFYTGYNDWWGDVGVNTAVYRHASPVFRMTGYYPILPLVLKEKAIAYRSGGQLAAAENAALLGGPKPVFTPSFPERASATALEAAVAVSDRLGSQLDRLSRRPPLPVQASAAGCADPWVSYCESLYQAIRHARSKGIKVLVALPPLMTKSSPARHADQQRATVEMVARHFADDAAVRIADLSRAIDLEDRSYSFDEMHLDQDGNAVVARALTPHVRAMIAE